MELNLILPAPEGGGLERSVQVRINFVTGAKDGTCRLVLVETGPWPEAEKEENLRRVGQRVADCIAAVINGIVAARFPETTGAPVEIQVASWSTPRWEMDALLARLQHTINTTPEIQAALDSGRYASSILLLHEWRDFDAEDARRQRWSWRIWSLLKKLLPR